MSRGELNFIAICLAPVPIIGLLTRNIPLAIGSLLLSLGLAAYSLREDYLLSQDDGMSLETAEDAYYNEGQPIMSDDEYDKLKRESDSDSVGAPVIGGTTHATRMRSLKNAIDEDELRDFFNRINATVGAAQFIVEPKIDGIAANATYSNYDLVSVTTRGDGTSGQDITDKVRHLFPEKNKLESAEIRGELYLSKSNLTALNKGRAGMGQKAYET